MNWKTPENCSFEKVAASNELDDPTYRRVFHLPLPHEAKITRQPHVGLIVPPSPFVVPCGWEWVHNAPFEGPSIIASLLKGLGFKVSLLDQRDDPDPESLRSILDDFDVIGLCCYEDCFPYLRRAAEIAKDEDPQRTTILGGPLVSSAPELLMNNMRADYAVIGEGELTLTELMDHLTGNEDAKPIDQIQGLAWKDHSQQVRVNARRPQMKNLDAVPFQDLSIWERFNGRDVPEMYLSYSRGCMGNCSFCYRAFPRLAYKSVERMRQEILYYKKRKFRLAWWSDLTFVTDTEYIHKLMDEALSVHDFRWTCFNRVDTVDRGLYAKMRERGCDIILYGLESVSPEILNGYHKGTNRNTIVNAIQLTRESGIKCGGLFIVGAPSETRESLRDTIDFCREFKEITRIKYLSLIPGTRNYHDAVAQGVIKDELAHLYWLAEEQSIEEDVDHPGFIKVADQVSKEDLKQTYRAVNTMIEQRPYDYSRADNIYLPKEKKMKFARRPVQRNQGKASQ